MLTVAKCRERQRRLQAHMGTYGLEMALLSHPKTIYYFTGALLDASWPHAAAFSADGTCTLVTNFEPLNEVAVEDVRTYTGYTIDRVFGRPNGHDEAVTLVRDLMTPGVTGIEAEWISAGMSAIVPGKTQNLTPAIVEMRRRKLPDEIESIRATTRLAEAGYAAVKEILEPGLTEVDAYLAIENAIVRAAGTAVELKGDFACGVRAIGGGGPPTRRKIQDGDLYILDLFPIFEGYMCDLCRTFVVGAATEEQLAAWEHVVAAHEVARRCIRPGASTRVAYEELRDFLALHAPARGSFTHHAGHGVGMEGWEQPWLNAGSDQTFIEGEVIACEPGLYSEALQGGIRLEHNYIVTSDGPLAIDTFPLEL